MAAGIQDIDFSVDLLQSILWQYTDAAKLIELVTEKNEWVLENHSEFWNDWYRDVFNLQTANDFGLSVWARILNVSLVYGVPGSGSRMVFGFDPYASNFNQPSSQFGLDQSGVVGLSTEQKRLILRLRFFQITSRGTIPEINFIMNTLFGAEGRVYALDGLDMTMKYVFTFVPAAQVLLILEQFDLLPRPAGVKAEVLIQPDDVFGFAPYYLNFNQSNFAGS